jgi:uncharacterized membrane protein YdcZ (DUF606 family)
MRTVRLALFGMLGALALIAGGYLLVTATMPTVRAALAEQGALLSNSIDTAVGVILFAVLVALGRYALATRTQARFDTNELYFVGGTLLGVVLLAFSVLLW